MIVWYDGNDAAGTGQTKMANPLELLKAVETTGAVAGKTPVEIFYNKLQTQIEYAGQIKAARI